MAHWHNDEYFKKLHGKNSLNGYDNLYDYVIDLTSKKNIKPLIIECFRDIVGHKISEYFQHYKRKISYDSMMDILETEDFKFNPYSNKLVPKYIEKLKTYQETESAKFCILKFEEIENRHDFFKNIGYEYHKKHLNNKKMDLVYQKVKNDFKISKNKLITIYDDPTFIKFYSEKEINTFINKWKK